MKRITLIFISETFLVTYIISGIYVNSLLKYFTNGVRFVFYHSLV